MKVQAERAEVVNWLKAGRCPACGFTFKACTCGPMIQMLLHICIERERNYAHLDFLYIDAEESLSDWKACAEAAEAEAAALRKEQESWRKGTESNMKSMAKLAENLKEELGEALREAAALRERERWIPVEEKLPKEGVWVLVQTTPNKAHHVMCWVDGDTSEWRMRDNSGNVGLRYLRPSAVTHWKALSAAPERPTTSTTDVG